MHEESKCIFFLQGWADSAIEEKKITGIQRVENPPPTHIGKHSHVVRLSRSVPQCKEYSC